MGHATQFDIQIAADQFQGNFLARITNGKINLAKAASSDAPLNRISVQGARTTRVRKPLRRIRLRLRFGFRHGSIHGNKCFHWGSQSKPIQF